MAARAVQVRYDGRLGLARVAGPGGVTTLWVPRVKAEQIAKTLGVELIDKRLGRL